MPYSSLFWYSVNYVTMFLFAIQLSPWLTLKAGAISSLLKWSSQSRRVCKEQAKSAALSFFSVLHIPLMVAVSVFSKSHFSSNFRLQKGGMLGCNISFLGPNYAWYFCCM